MICMRRDFKRIILYVLVICLSVALIFSSFHITLNLDEEYTMGLIQHSYAQLININMLDVHPPTYYILLKLILNIFTFWTKSIFIKIIIARLFSLVTFFISIYFLYKIVELCDLRLTSKILILFVYLLMPSVCLYATDIRMYSLYSLFNILEYYELIKFNKLNQNLYLILATIYAIIASYIDYFSAVCAGMFLIIFFIIYLLKKNKKYIDVFLSGMSLLICSIPLILIVLRQVSIRLRYSSFSMNMNDILSSFTQTGINPIIISISGTIIILLCLFWSCFYLNKLFNIYLFITLLNYLLSTILSILLCIKIHVFESGFMYPQFSIYSFFITCILVAMFSKYDKTICKFILIIFISLFMVVYSGKNIHNNIKEYLIPSFKFINFLNSNRNSSLNGNIVINYRHFPEFTNDGYSKPLYITQESIYLRNRKKIILLKGSPNYFSKKLLNGNTPLLRKTFNNLKFYNN